MNQASWRPFGGNRLKQGLAYQVFGHAVAHGIADNLPVYMPLWPARQSQPSSVVTGLFGGHGGKLPNKKAKTNSTGISKSPSLIAIRIKAMRPRTRILTHLGTVEGLGEEQIEKLIAGLIALCFSCPRWTAIKLLSLRLPVQQQVAKKMTGKQDKISHAVSCAACWVCFASARATTKLSPPCVMMNIQAVPWSSRCSLPGAFAAAP
jgi:hypothetical protein